MGREGEEEEREARSKEGVSIRGRSRGPGRGGHLIPRRGGKNWPCVPLCVLGVMTSLNNHMPAEWVKRVGKEVRWDRRELGTPSEKRD